MRILSLNAWGGQLHAELLPFLQTINADVFCLQEVLRAPGREPGWLVYRDGAHVLDQRATLFDEIAAVLPNHDAAFFPTSRGELFDGEEPVLVEFGIATFIRKSLPVIGQAVGFVHGAFSPDSYGEHPRPRNAHCVRLFDHDARRQITIAHMHGLRTLHGKGDSPERDAQTEALIRVIRSVRPSDERLLVCGDFNVLPDSRMLSRLAELGLRDLVVAGGHPGTRTSFYKKPQPFADYMLVTPDVSVGSFEVIRSPEVSDHCPLLLETESR